MGCPKNKFKQCQKHECDWYIQVQGVHPQTGETMSEFKCTMIWIPILLIENAQQSRQTGAAVESFRNEMHQQNNGFAESLLTAISQVAQRRISQ